VPIGAGDAEYLEPLQSHFSREWMPIVTFPTEDKSQMSVGVVGRGFRDTKHGTRDMVRHVQSTEQEKLKLFKSPLGVVQQEQLHFFK